MVGFVLLVVQVLVLGIVLCPLAVLYMLGLYLSAGISLWRLIQHDYGNTDGGANLKPALNVLYSLAMAQGVVYGYRAIYDLVAKTGLVEEVANYYSLETDLVSEYLDGTVAGCMKDPSFARGRNLVTYAVDLLMESKSRYGYISGVLILGKMDRRYWYGQQGLMKQLLTGSASFSHVVQRLLETFGPRSPCSTEIRVRAARIVATVAGSICLDHFPAQGMMMIQCVSSLLDTFEEYSWRPEGYDERQYRYKECDRGWLLGDRELMYLHDVDKIPTAKAADSKTQGYKGLVVQGLCILQGLAANEDNCRIIRNAQGLLYKAISPLISDQLHGGDHHDEWSSMAEESLVLISRLMATPYPGETGTKLPSEISGNIQVIIRAIKVILECVRCQALLKRQAVEVLLHLSLSVDTHTPDSIMLMPGGSGSSSSTMFVWILLHISLVPDYHFDRMCGSAHLAKKSSDIKGLAGEKLQGMLSSSSQAGTLRSVGDVIRSLATAVADAENNAYIRIHAAKILKDLVRYYTKDDENLKQLKKAMTDAMPEVINLTRANIY